MAFGKSFQGRVAVESCDAAKTAQVIVSHMLSKDDFCDPDKWIDQVRKFC